ncbi:MAG: alkaline phosphatase PhoX [Thermoleophilaceae bacterium]
MKPRRTRLAALLVAVPLAAAAAAVAQADEDTDVTPVATDRPAQLVKLAPGVQIDPILSASDIVGGDSAGDTTGAYQMSGIPDGIGAFRSSKSTVDLLLNNELQGTPSNARISHLVLDRKSRGVTRAEYVLDGSEGYKRFCSATLAKIGGVPWYFTGEENTPGRSVAINAQTDRVRETNHFGYFDHENVAPITGLPYGAFVSTEDGSADKSQLYAYFAPTYKDAIEGNGQLFVWKADGSADSTSDVHKSDSSLAGRFVPLTRTENANAATLENAAQAKGAFDFTRLEDVAQSKTSDRTLYFDDTGALGAQTQKGRLYQLRLDNGFDWSQFDASDPSTYPTASLKVLLDGDHGDDIVNPDNIDVSDSTMVIQEDRNAENRPASVAGGYGRVITYDLGDKTLTPVARVATPDGTLPGEWESSGVLDASKLLGQDWWLLDVQSHSSTVPQPGASLEPNSSSGEDGQLLAVRIPGSS